MATAPAVTDLAARDERVATATIGNKGIEFRNFADLYRFGQTIIAAKLAPKGIDTPEAVVVCIQFGLEVGLTPMQALQNVAPINGRPSIYGDAALALCEASGLLEDYRQEWTGEGDTRKCTVTVKRRNRPTPTTQSFSAKDAKTADLWGKSGPWKTSPDRMLMFRARGFALRDTFADVLKGMILAEEAGDIPTVPAVEMPRRASDIQATAEAVTEDPKVAQRAAWDALPNLQELPEPLDYEVGAVIKYKGQLYNSNLDRSAWEKFNP